MIKDACTRYCQYLETLDDDKLDKLADYVAQDVRFSDPFHNVRGIEAMQAIFRHMLDNVGPVDFTINKCAVADNFCMIEWVFQATLRGKLWSFQGSSLIFFNAAGLVTEHRDYWDSGHDFYAHLPIIGALLRFLKQRLAAQAKPYR